MGLNYKEEMLCVIDNHIMKDMAEYKEHCDEAHGGEIIAVLFAWSLPSTKDERD